MRVEAFCAVAAAYLSAAASGEKSDHGRVSGRAGSGCDRGKLYACSVFLPVQKGDCCHREAAIAGRAFFLLLLPEVLKCGGNFAMMK